MIAVSWQDWSCTVTIALPRSVQIEAARTAVEREMRAMDDAASRFRPDSELSRINAAVGRIHQISPLLAEAVATALRAAEITDGLVDPTLGRDIEALGYDCDIEEVRRQPGRPGSLPAAPRQGWRDVRLDGDRIFVPRGLALDLGATAKAMTADRASRAVAAVTGGPALVSIGGDLAAVGGVEWEVLLSERPDDRAARPLKTYDGGIATSSTLARRWTVDGLERHHLLDPRTRRPAEGRWRTVTVAAATCVDANTASTAAVVMGGAAPSWLAGHGLPARLVDRHGHVTRVGGWRSEAAA